MKITFNIELSLPTHISIYITSLVVVEWKENISC